MCTSREQLAGPPIPTSVLTASPFPQMWLPPDTLEVGPAYTFRVTTTDPSTGLAASASVNIVAFATGVVALINGGAHHPLC